MRTKTPDRSGGGSGSGPYDRIPSSRTPTSRTPSTRAPTNRTASEPVSGKAASTGSVRPPPRDRHGSGPRPSRPRDPDDIKRDEAKRADARRAAAAVRAEAAARAPTPPPSPIRSTTLRAPQVEAPLVSVPAPARGPAAPRGTVWLHGTHPVEAALANSARRLKRLLLTEDAEAELARRIPQPWPLAVERVERGKLDHLLGRDTVHQGAALLADLLLPPSLSSMLERPGPVLVLDQVTDPRNIGAMLRNAAAFGAAGVITQDRNSPEETGVMARAASGALERVPLVRAVNLARTLAALKAAGLWVIGLDASGTPLRGDTLQERRVALVLGAEGAGLRRLTRETCDELAGLPMPGGMESLNVSSASAVALYEISRPV
jgi:23S rRNA (guanosine2251-2'-O)-methyltransferase